MDDRRYDAMKVFFALLRAGLWEQGGRLLPFSGSDLEELLHLAEEQSVVGLIAAGLEHVEGMTVPKQSALPFLQHVLADESRNLAMNQFVAGIVGKMKDKGITTVLVKGQGVAQCYERPLWRTAGDVDLFFDEENYEKAKAFLIPLASKVDPEEKRKKHLALTIDKWLVELHGLMPTEISERINEGVVCVQRDIFENGGVRVWDNDGVEIFLPSPGNDVIIIFTHFLQHFFVGGVGLRQISDWCRLLWTFRGSLDVPLLEQRLREMGIMSEWRAFAAFAVNWLGMPEEVMPIYLSSPRYVRKARRICRVVLDAGNFGHNKDQSYRREHPGLGGKFITLWHRLGEFFRLTLIFPFDGPRFFLTYLFRRTKAVI